MKIFKQWKYTTRYNNYQRTRRQLASKMVFTRPVFTQKYMPLVQRSNEIRFLNFLEIKKETYYGKHQQFTIEERCEIAVRKSKEKLKKMLQEIEMILKALKEEIVADDERYNHEMSEIHVNKVITAKGNH